jgi:hypothetical protein
LSASSVLYHTLIPVNVHAEIDDIYISVYFILCSPLQIEADLPAGLSR